MLIDCDTCTVRGQGCDDCVVTVLLGAPPGWRGSDPTVVPLSRRAPAPSPGGAPRVATPTTGGAPRVTSPTAGPTRPDAPDAIANAPGRSRAGGEAPHMDTGSGPVVELDEVEQRAVRALADFGLVPPLRHQDASTTEDRHVS